MAKLLKKWFRTSAIYTVALRSMPRICRTNSDPFVDRLDYVAAMNNEHAYAMGVERMLGIENQIPKRVEYVRVLVAELNRIASHFIAIGTYGMDIGAFTPFFWIMRDREHILRMLEWASGAAYCITTSGSGGLF